MKKIHSRIVLSIAAFAVAVFVWHVLPVKMLVGIADPQAIVTAARAQIGVTVRYVPDYQVIDYPMGDVPRERGVCSDVVVRALRDAGGIDLQQLIHEDMKCHLFAYPIRNWMGTDTNIDHRRVANMRVFFRRIGWVVPSNNKQDFLPGDLVTCDLGGGVAHIMVVSDALGDKGEPLVIHNIRRGTVEESCLFRWRITGHYRVPRME